MTTLRWLEASSTVAVYVYAATVAVWVTALAVSCALRRYVLRPDHTEPSVVSLEGDSGPVRIFARTVVDYLGNASSREEPTHDGRDRRSNPAARVLIDRARAEALERAASPAEVERLMSELRRAVRAAEKPD